MELARRKFSSPQWWMSVWHHYNANLQKNVKDEKKNQPEQTSLQLPQPPQPVSVPPSVLPSTSKMIHPTKCASPPSAAVRPTVLDVSQPGAINSLATLGTGSSTIDATVLDLSNPTVLNTLASNVVFTPNTEKMLLSLTDIVSSEGLSASASAITVTSPSTAAARVKTMPAPTTSLPLMVMEESQQPDDTPSPPVSVTGSEGGEMESEYSNMSMESMDPMVAQAVRDSSNSGSLTPLIKTELKCTIQKKRILAGKTDIVVEELLASKGSVDELTAEEEEKRKKRRERNKVAAQKCRSKRKERAEELELEVKELEGKNARIKEQVEKLEQEKELLKRLLYRHDEHAKCPKRQRLSDNFEEDEEEELLDVLMLDGQTDNFHHDEVEIVMN